MARLTDHDVRDAESRVRAEIRVYFGKYERRALELGKAFVQESIETHDEADDFDGDAIGREVAKRALAYVVGSLEQKPPPTIDGEDVKELDA